MSLETARNIGIVVVLGLVVWLAPGGGEGASFISQLLNAIFIVLMALGCGILYRQYRGEIFSLGDEWRFALYAAVGVAIVTRRRVAAAVRDGRGRGLLVRADRGRRRTRCTSSGSVTARTAERASVDTPRRRRLPSQARDGCAISCRDIARRLSQPRVDP